MPVQLVRELKEELNLDANVKSCVPIGWYDNPVKEGESWWHWVVHLYAVSVTDLSCIVNREPQKHDEIRCVTFSQLLDMISNKERFAQNHAEFIYENRAIIRAAILKAMTCES